MTENENTAVTSDDELAAQWRTGVQWLSVPECAERLGVRDREVRSMLREGRLLSIRTAQGRGPQIPDLMLTQSEGRTVVLPALEGTITLLGDCGLNEDQAMTWLLSFDEELGQSPLDALRADRTHRVRRSAAALLL